MDIISIIIRQNGILAKSKKLSRLYRNGIRGGILATDSARAVVALARLDPKPTGFLTIKEWTALITPLTGQRILTAGEPYKTLVFLYEAGYVLREGTSNVTTRYALAPGTRFELVDESTQRL